MLVDICTSSNYYNIIDSLIETSIEYIMFPNISEYQIRYNMYISPFYTLSDITSELVIGLCRYGNVFSRRFTTEFRLSPEI